MKNTKFTESQIIDILKFAESGVLVIEICRNWISSAIFYKWRAKYGGMNAPMLSKVKRLDV